MNFDTYFCFCFFEINISLMKYILELFNPDCLYLSYVFFRLEKIKLIAERFLEMFRIHCQNPAILITNGIRKVRQAVDILDKRILDFCKIHLGQILVHETDILMLTHRTRFNQNNLCLSDGFGYIITANQACC